MSDKEELIKYFDNLPKLNKKGKHPRKWRYLAVLIHSLGFHQLYICKRLKIGCKALNSKLEHPERFTLYELMLLSDVINVPLSKIIILCYGFEPKKSVNEQIWHVKGLTLSSFDDLVRIDSNKP